MTGPQPTKTSPPLWIAAGPYKYSVLFLLVLSLSCIREISPPIRQSPAQLVVEGAITTDTSAYTVKLSYSGRFPDIPGDSSQSFINDAMIYLKDDQGDSTLCALTSPGTYQSADSSFIGRIGRSYTLVIHLSNGKTYVSTAEKINPGPPIDSITVVYDSSFITNIRPNQLILSAHTHDPASSVNYYRWNGFGYIPRKSGGVPFKSPLCEQFLAEDSINILSDANINGNEIIQPVFISPIYWHGIHYSEIRQYSINADEFLFWTQYLNQTNNTGTILSPLPASLIGNVHNATDSEDIALGFFSAASVSTKKVKIVLFYPLLQDYYLTTFVDIYIKPGDCELVYPGALADSAVPPGWEDAQEIDLY